MQTIIKRFIGGSFLGISIGYIISLIISSVIGQGIYYGATPELIQRFGSELNGMMIQTIGYMVLGGVYSAASYVFETDFSLTKQTALHFIITLPVFLIISSLFKWIPNNSIKGIIMTFVIYIAIYLVIWLIMYVYWKQKIDKLNKDIQIVH